MLLSASITSGNEIVVMQGEDSSEVQTQPIDPRKYGVSNFRAALGLKVCRLWKIVLYSWHDCLGHGVVVFFECWCRELESLIGYFGHMEYGLNADLDQAPNLPVFFLEYKMSTFWVECLLHTKSVE